MTRDDMAKPTLPHQRQTRDVPSGDQIGGRVLALETSVDVIADDVAGIRRDLGNVVTKDEMAGLRGDVRSLAATLQAQTKTQWPVILTGLGLVLSICIAVGGLAYLPIQQGQRVNAGNVAQLEAAIVPRSEFEARYSDLRDDLDEVEDRQYDALLRELERAEAGQ